MNSAAPFRWMLLMGTALVAAFTGLGGWLWHIQVDQHARFRALALANLQRMAVHPALRGAILDSGGTFLAASVPVKTVCVDPTLLGTQQVLVARTLAPILGIAEGQLLQRFVPQARTNATGKVVTNSYVVLKRKVQLHDWLQVTQAMSRLSFGLDERHLRSRQRSACQAIRERAVFGEDDELRQYPSGSLAAHVLGYSTTDEREGDQGRVAETHGLSGIELTMDQVLTGVSGWSSSGEEVAARRGQNVILTIDAGVQSIVETEIQRAYEQHHPGSVTALVIRPKTGEVLALANLPTYDPNFYSKASASALRNRAISDPTEPGSTFKVVVISGALNSQAVSLNDQFDCENGQFRFEGLVLHDHKPYGVLSVLNIITKSSNIGAAKVGIRLGKSKLYQYIRDFGFSDLTDIPLNGESRGYLRSPEKWEPVSISRIPMGHELLVTPLQMAMAMAAIANDGRLMRPILVAKVEDGNGRVLRENHPEPIRQVVSPAAARLMVTALKTVVEPGGTAPKAKLDYFTVAGKTGTAEKWVNNTYKSGVYFSSFIGFFPADDPQLCISVVLDDLHDTDRKAGHYGGEVAGPVFHEIAERVAKYLRLQPELQPDSRTKSGSDLLTAASPGFESD